MQSRMADVGSSGTSNAQCYQKSSAAIVETSAKAEAGNARCDSILSEATTNADAQLKSAVEALNDDNDGIQKNLQTCKAGDLTSQDALDCYEKQVIFFLKTMNT